MDWISFGIGVLVAFSMLAWFVAKSLKDAVNLMGRALDIQAEVNRLLDEDCETNTPTKEAD